MTYIRFKPENADLSPALQPGDLLRNLIDLQFPIFPEGNPGTSKWSPALDVYDDKDSFVVTLEAPGLKKDDFTISWHDDALHVAAERKEEKAGNERTCLRRERYFGRFSRTVSLPADVESGKIAAAYKDGVLTITLPKAEQAKPRQIEVSVN